MVYRAQSGFIGKVVLVGVLGIALFLVLVKLTLLPPRSFPVEYRFTVTKGDSVSSVATRLWQEKIIASPEAFKFFMIVLGAEHSINEGTYLFNRPITSFEVALKISGNDISFSEERITFPEGFTTKEMSRRLSDTFPGFDTDAFLLLVKEKEGYLFPDTYGFAAAPSPEDVVLALEQNFESKVSPLRAQIVASGKSEKAILTMASILEREANKGEEARVVAGILWKRLEKGIPLQVDAPFIYLLGKTSSELTRADLAVDSPYNTYRYKGLPPTPINNPGLETIEAALSPLPSKYLYYLHDAEGKIYYAETYKEHLENKKKHLQ